ncbi:hypothetical protein SASPL_113428 [Salvia splendens]|uniref:Uncharacterized protein n=1 Tax=Salvia splendens TaxID=180675 RepID=A0A8X8XYW9_SALSN|nr:hypothetical protein SASPL_113428 [Salvia splendens]
MVMDESQQAEADIWKFAFGFITGTVVKTSVELHIQDLVAKHGGSISLSALSAALAIPADHLRRIMRFLIHHGIFHKTSDDHYTENALSRLFATGNMSAFMMLHGPPPPTLSGVTPQVLRTGKRPDVKPADGEDTWTDPAYGNHEKVFTDAMEAHSRVTTSKIVAHHPDLFRGIRSVVDVGGRHGMALSCLIKAFPTVRGLCFDLPEVVAKAPPLDGQWADYSSEPRTMHSLDSPSLWMAALSLAPYTRPMYCPEAIVRH